MLASKTEAKLSSGIHCVFGYLEFTILNDHKIKIQIRNYKYSCTFHYFSIPLSFCRKTIVVWILCCLLVIMRVQGPAKVTPLSAVGREWECLAGDRQQFSCLCFILVSDIRKWTSFIFLHMSAQLFQHHLLNKLSLAHLWVLANSVKS